MEGFDPTHSLAWVLIWGFGLVTGVMTLIFGLLLPKYFPAAFEKMTILQAALYYLLFFILLASANYFYKSYFEGLSGFSWSEYLDVLKYTFLIGFFPLTFELIWGQQRRVKQNLKIAMEINKQVILSRSDKIVLRSENNHDVLKIEPHQFLFAENADNYVWINFKNLDKIERTLIRKSLKSIEEELKNFSALVRTHRSYIVNLDCVVKAEGNSRGLSLLMKDMDQPLPVSRRYIPAVRQYMGNR